MENKMNEKIVKLKLKLYKYFSESNDFQNIEDVKSFFIMSNDNVFGIEIKNEYIRKELLSFFNKNVISNIDLSFMDKDGSFFDPNLFKYCIELLNVFQNKKSVVTKKKGIYLNSGYNKPLIIENEYLKIYLCNMHSSDVY